MKTVLTLIAVAFALGCASTNFTEYRGADLMQGSGGTVRTVDGVDFWENGNPNRKVKVLGVIDDTRSDALLSRMSRDSALAKLAKSKGGDAVILMTRRSRAEGVNVNSGAIGYSVSTKVMVVKYVD